MKQIEVIRFLEFIGGERDDTRGKGSHFSYIIFDTFLGRNCTITLSKKEEIFGTVLRDWLFKSGDFSPEFVLEKWKEFKK